MRQSEYTPFTYQHNDYIGPVTTHNFHFWTAAPETTKNYLTLFRPFDRYVWGLVIVSVVAISLSLISVNMMHNKQSKQPSGETPFQSKNFVCESAYNTEMNHYYKWYSRHTVFPWSSHWWVSGAAWWKQLSISKELFICKIIACSEVDSNWLFADNEL